MILVECVGCIFLTSKIKPLESSSYSSHCLKSKVICSSKLFGQTEEGNFYPKNSIVFCEEYGIYRELTIPYTPEQNGVPEWKNRTVVEMTRSMLKEINLPNSLWAKAVSTAVYLLNISPTRSVLYQTPFKAWHGFTICKLLMQFWLSFLCFD